MQEKIKEYFATHKEEMLRDIAALIRIPSSEGAALPGMPFGEGPALALEEAMGIAREMGFAVQDYDHYVAAVDMNKLPRGLDMLAHLDTVPVGSGWQVTEPYQPLIRDGKLYGRGAADDKGPAMAALYAMKCVKDLGVVLNKNVRLVLGTNEETGSADMEHYYACEPEAPMTFSPDAEFPVINIEKGRYSLWVTADWQESEALPRVLSARGGVISNVVPDAAEAVLEGFTEEKIANYCHATEEKTGLHFQWKALEKGKIAVGAIGSCAHASTPENGNNAVTGLLELLSGMPFAESEGYQKLCALHQLFPHGDYHGEAAGVALHDDISGDLTLSPDIFEFDEGKLRCFFDSRVPVCATNENLRDPFCARVRELGLVAEDKEVAPAHHVPGDTPFVQTLLRCYEQYTGLHGECIAIGGGTYCHELRNGVAFGCSLPGTDNRIHATDEFAVVEELVLSAEIFAQVIIDLCS